MSGVSRVSGVSGMSGVECVELGLGLVRIFRVKGLGFFFFLAISENMPWAIPHFSRVMHM